MTSRRTCLAALGAGAGLALLGRPAIVKAQTPIALRVSSSMPSDPNSAHFVWHERFVAALKERVGDRIRLDYFPNGQLGKEADVVQQVTIGSVDMMIVGSSIWATAVPEVGMLDLGYVFDDFEHAGRLMDGQVGDTLSKLLLDRKGVTVIGWGFHFGARSVYTKQKVENLAGLKGVKLRVLPSVAFVDSFKIMGAVPAPIPFNELYTALQSGVVDGFEHDAASVVANRLFEVTKNLLETNHLFSPMGVFMGRRGLAKIPADLKTAFLEAAAQATKQERGDAASRGQAAIEHLKGLGVQVTPVSQADRRGVQARLREQLYAPFATKYPATKPLFEAVEAARV